MTVVSDLLLFLFIDGDRDLSIIKEAAIDGSLCGCDGGNEF